MLLSPKIACQLFDVIVGSVLMYGTEIWDFTKETILHSKRFGSRHFVKEMKIQSILLKYNMIFRKTNLKYF